MAIDTADKRSSAGSLLGWEILPIPDGTIGVADRLHVAGLYRGIAADAPAAPLVHQGGTRPERSEYSARNAGGT